MNNDKCNNEHEVNVQKNRLSKQNKNLNQFDCFCSNIKITFI